MLAACKAAFSGLGQSSAGGRSGGRISPSEKQVEAFMKALSDCQVDQIAAHVAESKSLLVSQLKCHPARSTAWHLGASIAGAVAAAHGGSRGGGAEVLQLLLRLYAEQDLPAESLPELLNAPNKRGQTPLHCAAAKGNADAVRLLLSLGCWLHLFRADKCGRTAVHYAAAAGSEDCVRLLVAAAEALDSRAAAEEAECVDGEDGDGEGPPSTPPSPPPTPPPAPKAGRLRPAASTATATATSGRQQQQQAAGLAVSRLVGTADVAGLTPLHFAAAANSIPVVRLLLAGGALYTAQATSDNLEASMPCNAGWTCLHVAAMKGRYEVAAAVLRFHSNLSAEDQVASWTPRKNRRSSDPRLILDRRGTSPYALALARGFGELAALLDPETPLSQSVAGGGWVGPDGLELRPPAMFVCPITQEVMREPVVAADGFTYERAAICRWLSSGKQTSPMTNLRFASKLLFPNNVLKSAIKEWLQEHKLPDPDEEMRGARRTAGLGMYGGSAVYDINARYGNGGGFRARAGGFGAGDAFLSHLHAHGL